MFLRILRPTRQIGRLVRRSFAHFLGQPCASLRSRIHVCQLTGRLIYPRQRPLSKTGWQHLNGSAALDTDHHRLRTRLVALRTTSVLIGASPHQSRGSAHINSTLTGFVSPNRPLAAQRAPLIALLSRHQPLSGMPAHWIVAGPRW